MKFKLNTLLLTASLLLTPLLNLYPIDVVVQKYSPVNSDDIFSKDLTARLYQDILWINNILRKHVDDALAKVVAKITEEIKKTGKIKIKTAEKSLPEQVIIKGNFEVLPFFWSPSEIETAQVEELQNEADNELPDPVASSRAYTNTRLGIMKKSAKVLIETKNDIKSIESKPKALEWKMEFSNQNQW